METIIYFIGLAIIVVAIILAVISVRTDVSGSYDETQIDEFPDKLLKASIILGALGIILIVIGVIMA